MAEVSYQEAVQTLKQRLNGRLERTEIDGRAEMARILCDELGYDRQQADEMLDALIQSGDLRYHRAVGGEQGSPPMLPVAASTMASGTPTTLAGAPAMAGMAVGLGYWEIGQGTVSGGAPGRAGQVDPTA